eukprot:3262230-Prymnesium_polylepis.1
MEKAARRDVMTRCEPRPFAHPPCVALLLPLALLCALCALLPHAYDPPCVVLVRQSCRAS